MKVILDSCVAGVLAKPVIAAQHDVIWMGDTPPDPGDDAVLQKAIDERRVLVTLDKDFGELTIVRGVRHFGLIRLVNFRSAAQGLAIVNLLDRYESELLRGAVLTAEPARVRIRLVDND